MAYSLRRPALVSTLALVLGSFVLSGSATLSLANPLFKRQSSSDVGFNWTAVDIISSHFSIRLS